MKYFYDTEFIEDGKTIDLISIGMVCEDGREYYAISREFDGEKASNWVKDNVLAKLERDEKLYKFRQDIKHDIIEFMGDDEKPEFWAYYADYDHVVLCQLFGTMMELPKNFPMFTMDIQQLRVGNKDVELPPQKNEHNALDDAKWNKECYEVLSPPTQGT